MARAKQGGTKKQTASRHPAAPRTAAKARQPAGKQSARPQPTFPQGFSLDHWVALEALLADEPRVQAGKMFGFPAFYTGGRLLACAVHEGIALKLPEPMAQALIEDGRASPFRPLDKFAMRSWIMLACLPEELAEHEDLITASIDFVAAEAQVSPGGRRREPTKKKPARQPKSRRQPKSGRRR